MQIPSMIFGTYEAASAEHRGKAEGRTKGCLLSACGLKENSNSQGKNFFNRLQMFSLLFGQVLALLVSLLLLCAAALRSIKYEFSVFSLYVVSTPPP